MLRATLPPQLQFTACSQQLQQSQNAQHLVDGAGSSAAVLSWLAQRPDAAGVVVQAAAASGSPFSLQTVNNLRGIMLLNEQEQTACAGSR